MATQDQDYEPMLRQLATLVFEMTRDMKYLLDHHHEIGPGQMGGEIHHPTAPERANELHTTLNATQRFFGVTPSPRTGETL